MLCSNRPRSILKRPSSSVCVKQGLEIGDIDTRGEWGHCFSITDQALATTVGALEAMVTYAIYNEAQRFWEEGAG